MGSLNALARAFCHARLRPPRQSPMSLSIGTGVFRPLLASPRALAATEVRSLRQSQRPQSYTTNHSPPPDTEPTVSDSLRSVMRQLPHPVVVITALDIPFISTHPPSHWSSDEKLTPDGSYYPIPRAMTVSSFTSLSLRPRPLVQFNITLPSRSHRAMLRARRFNIHVLTADHHGARLASCFTQGLGANPSPQTDPASRALGVLSGLDPLGIQVQGQEQWQRWWSQYCLAQPAGTSPSIQDSGIAPGSEPEPPLLRGPGVKHVLRCRHYTPEYLYPSEQQGEFAAGPNDDRDRFFLVLGQVEDIDFGIQETQDPKGTGASTAALSYAGGEYRGPGDVLHRPPRHSVSVTGTDDVDTMETAELQRSLKRVDQVKSELERALAQRAKTSS